MLVPHSSRSPDFPFNIALDMRRSHCEFLLEKKERMVSTKKIYSTFFGSLKGMVERNVKVLVHF